MKVSVMLSICTTVKNRSLVKIDGKLPLKLFPTCLTALAKSIPITDIDKFELVIADWQSTDHPIKEWIEDIFPLISVHLINVKSNGFSAGLGRNIAAQHAQGDNLFFMDADMIVNREVLYRGVQVASEGKAFYPTVKYAVDDTGKLIIHEGGGNVFMNKEIFYKAGKWPEYWSYGFEDTDFAKAVKSVTDIVVDDSMYIYHQWHPQAETFKKQNDDKTDIVVEERKKHYLEKRKEEHERLRIAIESMLTKNPHTTHSTLNKPAKADNRGLMI